MGVMQADGFGGFWVAPTFNLKGVIGFSWYKVSVNGARAIALG